MLIDFRTLFPKYNIKPNGVLHCGANVGEEAPVYLELGIQNQIWIEANPKIYGKLKSNVQNNPKAYCYNFAVGDKNGSAVLHESNNGSQSSSILDLGTHKIAHPDVHYVSDIPVTMRRIDSILKPEMIKTYNFLNVDVQGFELQVLKGMGDYLKNIDWAYMEVNKEELYKGCALVDDIDFYLSMFSFKRVETMWCGNTGWGDALYIKS
jgi:FkbM family methyltransferase